MIQCFFIHTTRARILALMLLSSLALLGGCSESGVQAPISPSVPALPPAPVQNATGLDLVLGQPAEQIITLLGHPVQDLRELRGRRLQYANEVCILDIYLYGQNGTAEKTVTYLEARNRSGTGVDAKNCLESLMGRNKG